MKRAFCLALTLLLSYSVWGQDGTGGSQPISEPYMGREEPYIISAVPYTEYTFYGDSKPWTRTLLDILGWSRDGKVLVFSRGHWGDSYRVIDLVNDSVIDLREDFNDRHDSTLEFADEDVIGDYIKKIAERYGIEPVVGPIGQFPYTGNDGKKYDVFVKDAPPGNKTGKSALYLRQQFPPDKMKFVNTFGYGDHWGEDVTMNKLKFWYARSPFENRIAIIPTVAVWISGAYDIFRYFLDLYGSHLGVGFTPDAPDSASAPK